MFEEKKKDISLQNSSLCYSRLKTQKQWIVWFNNFLSLPQLGEKRTTSYSHDHDIPIKMKKEQ